MVLFRRPAPPVPPPAPIRRPGPWSDGFGRIATRALQVLAVVGVLAVGVLAVTQLTLIVIPVLVALVLAAAIHPLVAWLRRRGLPSMPRPVSLLRRRVRARRG